MWNVRKRRRKEEEGEERERSRRRRRKKKRICRNLECPDMSVAIQSSQNMRRNWMEIVEGREGGDNPDRPDIEQ